MHSLSITMLPVVLGWIQIWSCWTECTAPTSVRADCPSNSTDVYVPLTRKDQAAAFLRDQSGLFSFSHLLIILPTCILRCDTDFFSYWKSSLGTELSSFCWHCLRVGLNFINNFGVHHGNINNEGLIWSKSRCNIHICRNSIAIPQYFTAPANLDWKFQHYSTKIILRIVEVFGTLCILAKKFNDYCYCFY